MQCSQVHQRAYYPLLVILVLLFLLVTYNYLPRTYVPVYISFGRPADHSVHFNNGVAIILALPFAPHRAVIDRLFISLCNANDVWNLDLPLTVYVGVAKNDTRTFNLIGREQKCNYGAKFVKVLPKLLSRPDGLLQSVTFDLALEAYLDGANYFAFFLFEDFDKLESNWLLNLYLAMRKEPNLSEFLYEGYSRSHWRSGPGDELGLAAVRAKKTGKPLAVLTSRSHIDIFWYFLKFDTTFNCSIDRMLASYPFAFVRNVINYPGTHRALASRSIDTRLFNYTSTCTVSNKKHTSDYKMVLNWASSHIPGFHNPYRFSLHLPPNSKLLDWPLYDDANFTDWPVQRKNQVQRIVYSLYGDQARYVCAGIRNAQLALVWFPGWKVRMYIPDESHSELKVPSRVLAALHRLGVELVEVGIGIPPMMWRFLVADDLSVDRFIIRDSDDQLGYRDAATVQYWIDHYGDRALHCLRDHPNHSSFPLSGGMIGGLPAKIRKILGQPWGTLIAGYTTSYLQDMNFLNRMIYPKFKDSNIYCSDAYSADRWPNTEDFPVKRDGNNHIGNALVIC